MFKKLGLYYRTIKHLKPIQIRYRLWYILRNKIRQLTGHSYPLSIPQEGHPLELVRGCPSSVICQPSSKTFTFLNQTHTFKGSIDWNFSKYGKLWAYNLNYFDYLQQSEITKKEGLSLIRDFIEQMEINTEGLEPYPISLRGINWITFLSKYDIKDSKIDASLYAQYQILLDNLEYHLLGNHLLENGCSLLFGAYYFQDKELYSKAKVILRNELEEQILNDGGHFERSTMYHCIMLERLLDCYNVVVNNRWGRGNELEEILKEKVKIMLGWLERMTVDRRLLTEEQSDSPVAGQRSSVLPQLPLLNDATKGIAPSVEEIFDYADRLGIESKEVTLSDSGYRRYSTEEFDLLCDVGNIGPDHQPGHAHSDTLSFVLYYEGNPIIIDPGISTYEKNERRKLERSTAFHNTIQVGDIEQSEVWGGFRVGRRAKIIQRKEEIRPEVKRLTSSHDGYKKWGIIHERQWEVDEDSNKLTINDWLKGESDKRRYFNLHFSPTLEGNIKVKNNYVEINGLIIQFRDSDGVKKETYSCPDGYNQYLPAEKIVVSFTNSMSTVIHGSQ